MTKIYIINYIWLYNFADRKLFKNTLHEVDDHFVEVNKTVEMPSNARPKTIIDYKLTRYACYLIVMNGDPRKKIIADGQTYFAIKTRQQELNELYNQLTEDGKRLFLRGDIKQKNMLLALELAANLFRIAQIIMK